jgi:hypothetical protein
MLHQEILPAAGHRTESLQKLRFVLLALFQLRTIPSADQTRYYECPKWEMTDEQRKSSLLCN